MKKKNHHCIQLVELEKYVIVVDRVLELSAVTSSNTVPSYKRDRNADQQRPYVPGDHPALYCGLSKQ